MTTSDEELAKDLGVLSALTIGVGTMTGAGIFVLPGQAAAAAGAAVALSFVVVGVISLFTALSTSEHSMVLIGATERGLLSRLARGSVVMDVVDDIECSVVLAERARNRAYQSALSETEGRPCRRETILAPYTVMRERFTAIRLRPFHTIEPDSPQWFFRRSLVGSYYQDADEIQQDSRYRISKWILLVIGTNGTALANVGARRVWQLLGAVCDAY